MLRSYRLCRDRPLCSQGIVWIVSGRFWFETGFFHFLKFPCLFCTPFGMLISMVLTKRAWNSRLLRKELVCSKLHGCSYWQGCASDRWAKGEACSCGRFQLVDPQNLPMYILEPGPLHPPQTLQRQQHLLSNLRYLGAQVNVCSFISCEDRIWTDTITSTLFCDEPPLEELIMNYISQASSPKLL